MPNPHPKPPYGKRNAAKPVEEHRLATSITLSPGAMAKVKRLAKAAGLNVSQMIEQLINNMEETMKKEFISPFKNEIKIDEPTMIRAVSDGREFTIIVRDGRVEVEGEFARFIVLQPQSGSRVFISHA